MYFLVEKLLMRGPIFGMERLFRLFLCF